MKPNIVEYAKHFVFTVLNIVFYLHIFFNVLTNRDKISFLCGAAMVSAVYSPETLLSENDPFNKT